MTREQVCRQVPHCLSCPLIKFRSGADCEKLNEKQIDELMRQERQKEKMYDVHKQQVVHRD